MFVSKDGLINIDQVLDVNRIVFPQAAWSIVNIPANEQDAASLQEQLYNSFSSRHVSLGLFRHKRTDKAQALSNLKNTPFQIYDFVTLLYEKATGASSSFLPLSEMGVILHKGHQPDIENTSWFAEPGQKTPPNCWALSQQELEPGHPTYQRFSWEVNLLMLSLAKPLETIKFIYGVNWQFSELPSIFAFCQTYNVSVQLYAQTEEIAQKVIQEYNR